MTRPSNIAAFCAASLLAASLPSATPAQAQTAKPFRLPRAAPTTAPVTLTGTLALSVSLFLNTRITNGTKIYVYASVSTFDDVYQNFGSYTLATVAKGGAASVTATIPYQWIVADTSEQAMVSLYVYAYPVSASLGTFSYSNSFSQTLPLPSDGATTPIDMSGSL